MILEYITTIKINSEFFEELINLLEDKMSQYKQEISDIDKSIKKDLVK